MKIIIPNYRAQSRNKTNKKHWTVYVKERREVAAFIMAYCTDRKPISPASVRIDAYYKAGRAVDTSNLDDKIIVDALMDIGILPDDTCVENPEVIKHCFKNTGEDKLVITITKYGD